MHLTRRDAIKSGFGAVLAGLCGLLETRPDPVGDDIIEVDDPDMVREFQFRPAIPGWYDDTHDTWLTYYFDSDGTVK